MHANPALSAHCADMFACFFVTAVTFGSPLNLLLSMIEFHGEVQGKGATWRGDGCQWQRLHAVQLGESSSHWQLLFFGSPGESCKSLMPLAPTDSGGILAMPGNVTMQTLFVWWDHCWQQH